MIEEKVRQRNKNYLNKNLGVKSCANCIFWKRNHGKGVEKSNTKFGECKSMKTFNPRDTKTDGAIPESLDTRAVFMDDGGDNLFWVKTGEDFVCHFHLSSHEMEKKAILNENNVERQADSSVSTIQDVLMEFPYKKAQSGHHATKQEVMDVINDGARPIGWEAVNYSKNAILIKKVAEEKDETRKIIPGSFKYSDDKKNLVDDGCGRIFDDKGNHVSDIDYDTGETFPARPLIEDRKMVRETYNILKEHTEMKIHGYKNLCFCINNYANIPLEFFRKLYVELEDGMNVGYNVEDYVSDIKEEVEKRESEKISNSVTDIGVYLAEQLPLVSPESKFSYDNGKESFVVDGIPYDLFWCIEVFDNKELDLLEEMKNTKFNEIKRARNYSYAWTFIFVVASFVSGVLLSEKVMELLK